jgi:flagellar hook assembly protein FlgD
MFSHLPTEGPATIRIFALDGTLVRTIHHNDTGSQHATWDMKNNFELPVASGMYIAHVETNHGEKVLKLAVIQPEQRLDVY